MGEGLLRRRSLKNFNRCTYSGRICSPEKSNIARPCARIHSQDSGRESEAAVSISANSDAICEEDELVVSSQERM